MASYFCITSLAVLSMLTDQIEIISLLNLTWNVIQFILET